MELFADVILGGLVVGSVWVGRDAEGRKGYAWRYDKAGMRVEPKAPEVRFQKDLELPVGARLCRH